MTSEKFKVLLRPAPDSGAMKRKPALAIAYFLGVALHRRIRHFTNYEK
jgi:hypothetical protein